MERCTSMSTFLVALLFGLLSDHAAVAQCSSDGIVNFTGPADLPTVYAGYHIQVIFTVNDIDRDGTLEFVSADEDHFLVSSDPPYIVLARADLPLNVTVNITGVFISIEDLELYFSSDDGSMTDVLAGSITIGTNRVPSVLSKIYIIILIIWIMISYLSMGGGMDLGELRTHLRRPYGVLIGLFSQFFAMPAVAYLSARVLADSNETAVGMVLVGTTPGGWLSNLLTVLLNADLTLSITMTFCSNVLALGMMPLNLYIYATPFTAENQRLATPFTDIAQNLAILVVPLFVGIAISYKFPKFKKFCRKVVKPIAAILVLIALGLIIPAEWFAFSQSPANNWIASVFIPAFGAFIGLSLARIFGRNIRESTTIAIETGVQNALLGRTIVFFAYPQPEADLLTRIILTVVLVTLIEGIFASGVFTVFRYLICKRRCDEMAADVTEGQMEAVANGNRSLFKQTSGSYNPSSYEMGVHANI